MSRGAARPGVFGPFTPERHLAEPRVREVAYCPKCQAKDVTSPLVFETNGFGAAIEACNTCGHAQPVAPSETRTVKARWGSA